MLITSLKARMLEAFRIRMYFVTSVIAFIFFIIFVQLVNLQIINGADYELKSRQNMENNIPIPAARGEIYDRNFKRGKNNVVLVSNRPSFNILTIPAKFETKEKMERTIRIVCKLLKSDPDLALKEMRGVNPWERVVLKEDVTFETVVTIASHPNVFPNITWEDANVRVYNQQNMFAHSIGYIGAISKEEYRDLKKYGYKHYQQVGKSGVEKQYDRKLRGRDGFIRRIVDVRQRTEGEEIGLQPQAGNNIVLTVDYQVQKVAFDALGESRGGVVVMRPSTGEIIALVSKPDFDPNLIVSKDNAATVAMLNADEFRPFLNRVIQSKYPPASTFKLITAISALESELANPGRTYFCSGRYTLRGYIDHDFYCYDAHGTLDMTWAIARSCSVYFYQLGLSIGPATIMRYANYFGLSEVTGIDIPGEIPGFIPSRQWKLRTFRQPWFDGDTVNMSIGQGFLSVTPIGMCNFVSSVVNNGVMYRPHMVREILSPDNGTVITTIQPERLREIPISQLTLNTVRQGMRLGVLSGTSSRLATLPVPAAGKTGTAQTRSSRQDSASQHAWWVGYAPFDGSPEQAVAVVVFVEYGVAGAASAVPIAERLFYKMYELGYFQ
jgi:penicillin-binding protein 2